jgi:transcriptional regulator with XRE-family HTH domain
VRVTIAEVARRARVSKTTVSRVLNNKGDVDASTAIRVREVIAGPDETGVYRAVIASPKTDGGPETKTSSFFPDAWTREEVERAIRHAFLNRTYFDGRSARIRRKWRGRYRNVHIEGYVECQVIEPTIDARSARLYHIVTAYPILRGGGNIGQDA